MHTCIRNRLLAISKKVAPYLNPEAIGFVEREIIEALEELSVPESYKKHKM